MSDTDSQAKSTEIEFFRELVDLQERHIERLNGIRSSLRGLNVVVFLIFLGIIVSIFQSEALASQIGRMRVY